MCVRVKPQLSDYLSVNFWSGIAESVLSSASPGGRPPPAEETGKSKLVVDQKVGVNNEFPSLSGGGKSVPVLADLRDPENIKSSSASSTSGTATPTSAIAASAISASSGTI